MKVHRTIKTSVKSRPNKKNTSLFVSVLSFLVFGSLITSASTSSQMNPNFIKNELLSGRGRLLSEEKNNNKQTEEVVNKIFDALSELSNGGESDSKDDKDNATGNSHKKKGFDTTELFKKLSKNRKKIQNFLKPENDGKITEKSHGEEKNKKGEKRRKKSKLSDLDKMFNKGKFNAKFNTFKKKNNLDGILDNIKGFISDNSPLNLIANTNHKTGSKDQAKSSLDRLKSLGPILGKIGPLKDPHNMSIFLKGVFVGAGVYKKSEKCDGMIAELATGMACIPYIAEPALSTIKSKMSLERKEEESTLQQSSERRQDHHKKKSRHRRRSVVRHPREKQIIQETYFDMEKGLIKRGLAEVDEEVVDEKGNRKPSQITKEQFKQFQKDFSKNLVLLDKVVTLDRITTKFSKKDNDFGKKCFEGSGLKRIKFALIKATLFHDKVFSSNNLNSMFIGFKLLAAGSSLGTQNFEAAGKSLGETVKLINESDVGMEDSELEKVQLKSCMNKFIENWGKFEKFGYGSEEWSKLFKKLRAACIGTSEKK